MAYEGCGIVYVATGAKYVEEALHAAASARKAMPGCPIALLTDKAVESPLLDQVVVVPEMRRNIRDKLFMNRSPFEKTIFIDTDTYVVNALDDLFRMLERFDVVAHQSSSGYHYTLPNVPNSFPEFNTGLIAFRKGAACDELFRIWAGLFDAYEGEMGREWDQRSFREAVYVSSARCASLSFEWNLMPYGMSFLMNRAMVVHGRPVKDLPAFAERVNRSLGGRVYVPSLGIVPSIQGGTYGQWLGIAARAVRSLAYKTVQPLWHRYMARRHRGK